MDRILYKTPACEEFYRSLHARAKKKVDYIFEHIRSKRIVSTKFVKHLVNTDFYEMRISVDNEYRVILFTIDNDSFINANEIIVLNGFVKKSSTDYNKQIEKAIRIMEDYI